MTGEPSRPGGGRRARRIHPAEARARRAAVEDPAVVLEAALRLLEARPRSVGELRQRLTAAGYRAELVDAAAARLADLGLLDDAAFGRAWLESRDRAHPRGEHALRSELVRKRLPAEMIAALLEERRERAAEGAESSGTPDRGVDDDAADRVLARAGARLLREPDPGRRRNRAYATLARQGFDPATATEAIQRWIAASAQHPIDEADGADTAGD